MPEEQVETSSTTVEVKPDSSVATPTGENSSPTSTKAASKGADISKAASSLSQGKRFLLIKDVQQAIACLGEACTLYSDLLGPFTAESGESHFYYGKALLDNARSELSVLPAEAVGKIQESNENEDDDDDDEEEEDEEEKEDDDEKPEEDNAKMDVDSSKEEDLNTPSPLPASASKENDVVPAEVPGPSNEISKANGTLNTSADLANATVAEGEEEQSSLELAWEVLEIAKVAYQKQLEDVKAKLTGTRGKTPEKSKEELENLLEEETELKRRLADVFLLLGDVATESEMYEQAEEEFNTALALLREVNSDDSREVAQCYFQLGLAYHFDKKFVESIESYQKAVTLIKLRIQNLETLIENKETLKDKGVEPKDPNYSEAQEIQELKSLLPELQEKVADTIDAQKESQRSQEEEKVEQEILERNSPVKNLNAKPAFDISHLVKKKKKLELDDAESTAKLEPPAKKQCVEPTVVKVTTDENGVGSTTNGNGVHHD